MHGTFDLRHGGRPVHSRASHWFSVLIAAVAILLALPAVAQAQEQVVLPAPAASQAGTVQDEKSPATALMLSLLSTGVGVGLIAGAGEDAGGLAGVGALLVFVGPNLGHFYAGEAGRGLTHIGVRAGAAGAMFVGAAWTLFDSCSWGLYGEESHCDGPPPGAARLIGGAVVGSASVIYSIYDAPRAARRANDRSRSRQFMFTPAPVAGPHGTSGLGLHLTGRF
jgi:hypothetical protein